ncbi:kinase-like domain-containing protein [Infundibulicybe gibba]|nr:kinase-like domain-containing protein [Infundibulicybe gibba]
MDQQRLYCRYTPRSNIMVQSTSFMPLITSEVVSDGAEIDRARMQIQAIALVRAGQLLIDDGAEFFVVAIYLTKSLIAERFIVVQPSTSDEKVFMYQKNFDLSDPTGAVLFLLEMYNLAPKLKELAGKFKLGTEGLLAQIQKAASGLLSLTAASRQRERFAVGILPTAAEGGEGDVADGNHDGLDVFGTDEIQHILKEMDYTIDFIPFGHPFVAFVSNVTDRSKTGFLKFVKETQNEIPILQYLSGINSPRNHTISGVQFWPVRGGQVISMPSAGTWVTDLKNLDAQLWSVVGQLFEAVDFMHQHGVAHLDLKPANIIIPSDGGRLSIIDFHTSVRVEDVNTMFRGAVGTVGYIPPEVEADRGRFSAVRADLWSCGKVLDDLCDLCQPSADCDKLLQIARELMDEDPKRRPMMFDILERMAQYKAGGGDG